MQEAWKPIIMTPERENVCAVSVFFPFLCIWVQCEERRGYICVFTATGKDKTRQYRRYPWEHGSVMQAWGVVGLLSSAT